MNNTDLKNMKALLRYKKVVAKGPTFVENNSTVTKDELETYSIKKLESKIKSFEKSKTNTLTVKLKNIVDELFEKYGEETDNMIAVWDANVIERDVNDGDGPLEDINFNGYEHKYNELYYPICSQWKNLDYWKGKDIDEEADTVWLKKWREYLKDIKHLKNVLTKLSIKNASKYWEKDNEALYDCWYGVIGIMRDYQVVAFVIRDDGVLCDEKGYETFYNKIVKKF